MTDSKTHTFTLVVKTQPSTAFTGQCSHLYQRLNTPTLWPNSSTYRKRHHMFGNLSKVKWWTQATHVTSFWFDFRQIQIVYLQASSNLKMKRMNIIFTSLMLNNQKVNGVFVNRKKKNIWKEIQIVTGFGALNKEIKEWGGGGGGGNEFSFQY